MLLQSSPTNRWTNLLLQPFEINEAAARQELATLKKWMDEHEWFIERDIVKKLRETKYLCGYLGKLSPLAIPTHMQFEVSLLGAFRADLVVGDLIKQRYVFIEFEGGSKNSIYSSSEANQMRSWGREFSKGWSQLMDWSWAMRERNDILGAALGSAKPHATYYLVCGRDACFSGPTKTVDEERYKWLSDNAIIAGGQLICMTYDSMVAWLAGQIGPASEAE
jgi:hypothetical protein